MKSIGGGDTWSRLLLLAGSIVISLLLAEIVLRIAFLVPGVERRLAPRMIGWTQHDHELLFTSPDPGDPDNISHLREVQGYRHVHDSGDYDYVIDTVPCRGRFIRPPCLEGAGVSYHFGDSFTFGFGVEADETFVSLLSRDAAGGHVNFGLPGNHLLSQLGTAPQLLSALDGGVAPEALYFHLFFGNDLHDAWKVVRRKDNAAQADSFWAKLSPKKLIKRTKLRKIVHNRLVVAKMTLQRGGGAAEEFVFVPKYLAQVEVDDQETMRRLHAVLASCAERLLALRRVYDGSIVVTFIPPKDIYLTRDDVSVYRAKRNTIEAALRPFDVTFVDLLDHHAPGEILSLYFHTDTHFNVVGHQKFAEVLGSYAAPLRAGHEAQRRVSDANPL
jgi:hypothetical protein